MGHLINPIAYRLGHTRSWEDNWFIKNIYYPEFLHSILKIRQYIHYFWTTRFMEKKGILLSHFYIYKFMKHLLIKIFLYNTDFEKYIYSFFARGVGVFSDSFYYRFKKKKKKKEPFCYERYKPDLFFLLFFYYAYFSKLKVKRRKIYKKNFKYIIDKCKKNNLMNMKNDIKFKALDGYLLQKKVDLNYKFLNKLKNGDLNYFLKLPVKISIKNKENLRISKYEDKIRLLTSKRINLGFLDFLVYVFFKINMLEKRKEEIIKNSRSRKHTEMVLYYPLKIKRWIILIKKYIELKILLGKKKKRKRSIKNFVFFLIFIINIIKKVRNSSSRIKFRLRELNLKLIRLFLFNKILTEFAFFYGKFLTHILCLFTKIRNLKFKFCFITNNSVNARFLTRYMGLKLKRKFPLFFVVNPLKKEFRKLSSKKKEKKYNLLFEFFNSKMSLNKVRIDYKESFRSVLIYLLKKYLEFSFLYYEKYKTLIMIDIYIFFLILRKKYKYQSLLILWKKKFIQYFNENVWLKQTREKLNKKWITFLLVLLKKRKIRFFFSNKLKILLNLFLYNKNKLIVNLFFSYNKYNIDNIVFIFFNVKGDVNTFFFLKGEYIFLVLYSFFFNYNLFNYNSIWKINSNIFIMSQYFFKSYMSFIYMQYSFNKLINYIKINKRNYFLKMKELYSTSSFFLGYKMSFKGRFTRKQRASSVWFHQGFVPLNTIKGHIDYSFFTIPLKNSAVSIKLWLYKNTNEVIWDSKFLNKK